MTDLSGLSEYLSDKNKIIELKKQVVLLQKVNSKWKRKFEKLKSDNPTIKKTRSLNAAVLVKAWIDGDRSLTFKEMAVKCFLSLETIKNISYKLRHTV